MSSKNSWPCWSCKNPVTMKQRANADGDCPHCGVELDIESWPYPDGAAPVVERQPVPVMKLEAERLLCGDGEYAVSFVKSGWLDECRKTGGSFLLYTAPPELAELQAAVARLTAENERLTGMLAEWDRSKLGRALLENHELKAEIERLKGGQGEAVAWIKPDVLATLRKDECCYAFGGQNPKGTLVPLYTSQPAPVSVVLPEGYMIVERSIWTEEQAESAAKCIALLKNVPGMTDRDLALAAMDAGQCKAPDITLADLACLDKVKELNQ